MLLYAMPYLAKPCYDNSPSTTQHSTAQDPRERGGLKQSRARKLVFSLLSSHLFVDHDGAEESGNFLAIILGALGLVLLLLPLLPFPWVFCICTVRFGGEGGGTCFCRAKHEFIARVSDI